jgi:hypothetical protein
MPLFPLSQAALFPRAQLPLHVFEARYRKMLADCIEQHGIMAIVMVPDPADLIDPRGHPRLARVAGVGFVKEVARLPDGRSDIVLEGLARVSLEELPFEIPYRRARATLLETRASRVTQNDSAALVAAATAFVTEMRRRDADVAFELPEGLVAGQLVLVTLRETPTHSLKTFLYNGDPGDIAKGKQLDTKMVVRIAAVRGARVEFDRPLRFETRAEWKPEIRSFRPTVTESGVEGLAFEFPATKYRGHFAENGANAIELRSVYNCWVRDVAIRNGDLGVNIVACGNTVVCKPSEVTPRTASALAANPGGSGTRAPPR